MLLMLISFTFILRSCSILGLLFLFGTTNAQSFVEDSIEIEQYILVDFCGPDFVQRDSLTVDIHNPKTLSLLLDNISNTCFTGYEENLPIAGYLIDRIDVISVDTIVSRIHWNSIDAIFHIELLYYKLKSLKDISIITISSEDFTHLHPDYFHRLQEVLSRYSLK